MSKTKNQQKPQAAIMEDTVRTTAGLRSALFDELDGLRKGTVNATRANAVAKLAATVVETARLDLDMAKYAERNKLTTPRAKAAIPSVELVA